MGDFESELVRLMFKIATDSARDGVGEKKKYREQQHQDRQGRPVIEPANLPSSAPAGEHPPDQAIAKIGQDQQKHGKERDLLEYVLQNVVTGFVSGHEHNLRRVHFGNGRVKDDDAL